MRTLIKAMLLGLVFLLASPLIGQARTVRHAAVGSVSAQRATPSGISLTVSVGYRDVYRGTAWTPVRTTLHNGTNADVNGTLQVPENGQAASIGASPSFHGLYEAPVLLPAGGTKHVSLYVPGPGVQGLVRATFQQGSRTLASGSAYALGIDSGTALVGVMAQAPGDSAWIAAALQSHVTARVVPISVGTLDPVPEALAAFDIIALTNVDTSQLDHAQFTALQRYVSNGGSLLLVGGPSWQETLRPLPAALVPGQLAGTRTLRNLHGLSSLATVVTRLNSQSTAISYLSHPSGAVLASQSGIPLAVRKRVGAGIIEYLGFDPALGAVAGWGMTSGVLEHLVATAAPLAIARTWSPQGFRPRARRALGSLPVTTELSNAPPITLPLFALLAVLTLVYVLFLGPANFLVLRWMGRQNLAWVTVPVLSLSYLGSTVGVTAHFRNDSVMLNSVGMIRLDSHAGAHPATFYLGLTAPFTGEYQLTYHAPALPAPVPELSHFQGFFWRNAGTLTGSPVGLRLSEGSQTDITFLSMKRLATRDVALHTSVYIPGTVRSDLTVNTRGEIVGTIYNGTNLDLLDPVIVVGQKVIHIPTIAAGAALSAHLQPGSDFSSGSGEDGSTIWNRLYGDTNLNGGDRQFGGFGDCCSVGTFPAEKTLSDHVANASAMLSQVENFTSLGPVTLVGWSDRSFGSYSVDGRAPTRRDLTLVAVPLGVQLPAHGRFTLQPGTLASHVIDLVPRAPQSSCCNFFSRNSQQLALGPGGSLTFEFDAPGGAHIRFQRLTVSVNSSGTIPSSVYDWRAQRWVNIDVSSGAADLSRPNRFLSPRRTIVVKLQATAASGDIQIDDPYGSVQISAVGEVT